MPPIDPFAGMQDARDAADAVAKRLREDHGLSDADAEACEKIIGPAVAALTAGTDKAAGALKIADAVAGFIKNPRSLLSFVGL